MGIWNVKEALKNSQPHGYCNITKWIIEFHSKILSLASQISPTSNKIIGLVICTNSIPIDDMRMGLDYARKEFIKALDLLRHTPTRVILRLSTDDEKVVNFSCHEGIYSKCAESLMSLVILRSYLGETKEVQQHNPWMNYAIPLHRYREFGAWDNVINQLGLGPLGPMEVKHLCQILLDDNDDVTIPDPLLDWSGFF